MITPPPHLRDYTLTEYQSNLLLIGREYSYRQDKAPTLIVNKFDEDHGWLPVEDIDMSSINSVLASACNAKTVLSAVSEGRHIIISWIADYRFKLLIIDGLNKCKEVEGPPSICRGLDHNSWSNVMVHDGMLYLSDSKHTSIYSIPLESLGNGREEWDTLPDLPSKNFSRIGAPNLTIVNSSVLATIIPSHRNIDMSSSDSYVVALEPHTKSWIELGKISCDVSRKRYIKIVGLPLESVRNADILVMGKIHANKYFALLEISATGMCCGYTCSIVLLAPYSSLSV